MIEIGQAVYFIESRGLDPVIKFGIVRDLWEDKGFYHYAVDFLSIKEHRYIKGIPFEEFTNTEWRKIPKELRDKAHDTARCSMEIKTRGESFIAD